jgi:hypothetical protein
MTLLLNGAKPLSLGKRDVLLKKSSLIQSPYSSSNGVLIQYKFIPPLLPKYRGLPVI